MMPYKRKMFKSFLCFCMLFAVVGLNSACTFSLTNDRISVESYPTADGEKPAWVFGAESPDFKVWSSLDAVTTINQIIDGGKQVLAEAVTIPGVSQLAAGLGGLLDMLIPSGDG